MIEPNFELLHRCRLYTWEPIIEMTDDQLMSIWAVEHPAYYNWQIVTHGCVEPKDWGRSVAAIRQEIAVIYMNRRFYEQIHKETS